MIIVKHLHSNCIREETSNSQTITYEQALGNRENSILTGTGMLREEELSPTTILWVGGVENRKRSTEKQREAGQTRASVGGL